MEFLQNGIFRPIYIIRHIVFIFKDTISLLNNPSHLLSIFNFTIWKNYKTQLYLNENLYYMYFLQYKLLHKTCPRITYMVCSFLLIIKIDNLPRRLCRRIFNCSILFVGFIIVIYGVYSKYIVNSNIPNTAMIRLIDVNC